MLLLLLALMCNFVIGGEYDLTVEVPAGRFECFFQPVIEKHKTFEIDYQVIDGGDLNINFMLMLGAKVLVQDSLKVDNTHRIENPEAGDYQICFDNTFSYQSKKIVFFEIYLYDSEGNLEEEDISKYGQSDPELQKILQDLGMTISQFHNSFNKIKADMNKMEYHQSTLRSFEARDRSISMAQNDRVLFWSVLNTVVLLVVGIVQVYMIRSLFEENSRIGRVLRK